MGFDDEQESAHGFSDFAEFQTMTARRTTAQGNVIKAASLKVGGRKMIGAGDSPSSPKVLVHKRGDAVESVEFQCVCGRHASLHFESEGE